MIQRASGRDDLASWAAIKNQITPLDRITVDELDHDLASQPNGLLLLASTEGAIAGCGVGKPGTSMPDTLFAMARVLPELRRRGVGSALWVALSDHARQLNLTQLSGRCAEDDAESTAWVTRRGFIEIARDSEFLLTLGDKHHDLPRRPSPGVQIVSLAERPDLATAAHAIESEAILDIPGPFPQRPVAYDAWAAENIGLPGFLAGGSFVALRDGQPVGYAGLNHKEGHLAEHLLTGVIRNARGRGIATALKMAQIRWAKRAGYEQLVTWTSSRNDPMRAINLRLGYVEQPASITVRGPLARLA